ncbi:MULTISPECIES: hypothetical protein [Exiguobacterium]|uniref:hypothetical protein n=1 Tax=Exiguobacterium TaxID=33986 RepID=UPI001BEC8EB1|nr:MULTISPECIES: hypothetical protein [Exiguobacterium]MCT4776386.1 hypothetical protein [Exiguobacterium aquaticum]MCT4789396.1 hypothetical protein [Exiguobacterium mexicanum]
MKFIDSLLKKFDINKTFVLKGYLWWKELICYILSPPDHLKSQTDAEPIFKGPFRFIEMFDHENEFKSEYQMQECEVLTYGTTFPLDALEAPFPPTLSVSLHTFCRIGNLGFDFVSTSSTITFYGNEMAKHTIHGSRGTRAKGGWYDRETSRTLFSEFESFHFEEWEDDFDGGRIVFDGNEWSLTATYEDGHQKMSHGFLGENEPANWQQINSYFGLSSNFHRAPLGGSKDVPVQPSLPSVDVKELFKFMTLYMVLPLFGLIVFLFWVWTYFEIP